MAQCAVERREAVDAEMQVAQRLRERVFLDDGQSIAGEDQVVHERNILEAIIIVLQLCMIFICFLMFF